MEGGEGPSIPFGQHQNENSAAFNQEVDATDTGINEEQPTPPPPARMREHNYYIPLANMTRIMRQILPQHIRISEDAKETLQVCVSEFIRFLTSEANNRCHQDCRITVTPDDILWAVRSLGFHDYMEPLTTFLNRLRGIEGRHYTAHGPMSQSSVPPLPPPQGHFLVDPNLNTTMDGSFQSGELGASSNTPMNDNLSNQP